MSGSTEGYLSGCLENESRVLVGLVETDSRIGRHDFVADADQELLAFGIEADTGIEALELLLDTVHAEAQLLIELSDAVKSVERYSDGDEQYERHTNERHHLPGWCAAKRYRARSLSWVLARGHLLERDLIGHLYNVH